MPRPTALVFAYNSDGGVLNGVLDILRGLFAPSTFPCRLCQLTYSPLGMKKQWWEYIKGLNIPLIFLHRDDLKRKYGMPNAELPAVYRPEGNRLVLLIDADEINRCADMEALIRLMDRTIS